VAMIIIFIVYYIPEYIDVDSDGYLKHSCVGHGIGI
jgi:hypothetical protein